MGVNILSKFQLPSSTVWDLWCLEDWEEKDDRPTLLISDEAVYRTAPATPGLVKSKNLETVSLQKHDYNQAPGQIPDKLEEPPVQHKDNVEEQVGEGGRQLQTKTNQSTWFNTLVKEPTTPGGRLAGKVKKALEKCRAPGRNPNKW